MITLKVYDTDGLLVNLATSDTFLIETESNGKFWVRDGVLGLRIIGDMEIFPGTREIAIKEVEYGAAKTP